MKAIVIDDEPWMLQHFSDACAGLDAIQLVGCYRNPKKALEYAQSNEVELAFVDMEMPVLNGVETAKKLCELLPEMKIIIVSAYEASDIESMHSCPAYGYLRKPYTSSDLQDAINKITSD